MTKKDVRPQGARTKVCCSTFSLGKCFDGACAFRTPFSVSPRHLVSLDNVTFGVILAADGEERQFCKRSERKFGKGVKAAAAAVGSLAAVDLRDGKVRKRIPYR